MRRPSSARPTREGPRRALGGHLVAVAAIWAMCSPGEAHSASAQWGAKDGVPSDPIEEVRGWQERMGPIAPEPRARRRVRGDRPDGAGIHVSYAAPVHVPDALLRDGLAFFEDEAFPSSAPPRSTVVDNPTEAWMRSLARPDFRVRWNDQTQEYLRYFRDDRRGQNLIRAWTREMHRWSALVRPILDEVGVPEALIHVAMVESGFHPDARSGVGAAGLWQFMEPTAKVYGLETSYWIDERLDYERATWAAATYLKDLHTRFGSWELALAAYNAGYGLLIKSIQANNSNNFWALCTIENGLPRQTMNYVPKIFAAAIAAQNPEVFGLESRDPGQALHPARIEVPAGTRLDALAKALQVDEKLIKELNAQYVRGRVPPKDGSYPVKIPTAAMPQVADLSSKLAAKQQPFAPYTVRHGETLDEIAAAHGLTTRAFRRLNGVHDSGEVVGGTVLVVPKQQDDAPSERPPLPAAAGDKGGASQETPRLVATPPMELNADQRRVFFRVTRASSARAIAESFRVSWDRVVAWNDLDPQARLVDGQILQIRVSQDFDPVGAGVRVWEQDELRHVIRGSQEHLEALLDQRGLVRRAYVVKKGDTMSRVARRFDLSLGSLARINGVKRGHSPKVGETLIVYVEKGKTRGTKAPPEASEGTLTRELAQQAPAKIDGTQAETREASTASTARVPGVASESSEEPKP